MGQVPPKVAVGNVEKIIVPSLGDRLSSSQRRVFAEAFRFAYPPKISPVMKVLTRSSLPKITFRCVFIVALLLQAAHAAPVVNWVVDQGSTATSAMDTNSPVVGDGTPENADRAIIHAVFPSITLASSGDSLRLTGSVTLFGITSTDAGTFHQLRFGLFDNLGSLGANGWLGYYAANSTSVNAGVIRQRNAGNGDLFISNNGSTIVASTANPPHSRTGAIIANDTYNFFMELKRDGDNLDISASLSGGPGGNFFDSFTIENLPPAATETFTFNTVGFLLADAMNVDQAQYNNIEVAFVPEPASCLLLVTGSIFLARRKRSTALKDVV